MELKGKRSEIYSCIQENRNADTFFLKTKPNVMMFAILLNETRVRRLYITEGVSKTIPKSVMEGLQRSMEVIVRKCARGRPRKYEECRVKEIMLSGKSNEEQMKALGMPRRTYFYWKKKLRENDGKGREPEGLAAHS
ncbi:MAG: hypothetical protein QXH30_03110 [Candidatus Bilamarchaeaceae archaeon]